MNIRAIQNLMYCYRKKISDSLFITHSPQLVEVTNLAAANQVHLSSLFPYKTNCQTTHQSLLMTLIRDLMQTRKFSTFFTQSSSPSHWQNTQISSSSHWQNTQISSSSHWQNSQMSSSDKHSRHNRLLTLTKAQQNLIIFALTKSIEGFTIPILTKRILKDNAYLYVVERTRRRDIQQQKYIYIL